MALLLAVSFASCRPANPGIVPEHEHLLIRQDGLEPTTEKSGYKYYYQCEEDYLPCGKYFEDGDGVVEIPDLEAWKSEGGRGYLPPIYVEPEPEQGEPEAYGAIPTEGQIEWQKQECTMFFHFGPATFSGYDGDRNDFSAEQLISQFRPSAVDCDQWAKTASECGFKGVILTVKHHDGFCLWDNPESECDVASCPEGYNGDVLKKLSEACAKYGLNLGIYMSPWDKVTSGDYHNKYLKAIESLLSGNYGKINEFWLDGHNAQKSGIDFTEVNAKIQSYNPDIVIFSNVGPGCRWVGNEDGNAGEKNWSTFSPAKHGASQTSLPGSYWTYLWNGDENGTDWIPAETDLSIRRIGDDNGWFWGAEESPKTAKELMKVYYESAGRNSLMLLNVPPTTSGVLDDADVQQLKELYQMRSSIFSTNLADGAEVLSQSNLRSEMYSAENMLDGNYDSYFATKDGKKSSTIEFKLKEKCTFNRVVLQEYIPKGQRVRSFTLKYKADDGTWKSFSKGGSGSTIGYKRIMLTNSVTTDGLRLEVSANDVPLLNGLSLYNDTISGL